MIIYFPRRFDRRSSKREELLRLKCLTIAGWVGWIYQVGGSAVVEYEPVELRLTKSDQDHSIYPWLSRDARYNSSTFVLAQGVLRRNFRLDLIEGSWVKQRILIRLPNSFQPYTSTRLVTILSKVIPCKGLLGWVRLMSLIISF